MKQSVTDEAIKVVPAVGGGLLGSVLEFDWQTIVWVITAIYGCIQIAYLVRKWWREERHDAKKQKQRHEKDVM